MTGRLPALRPRQVIAALERSGFFVHHATGSHYALRHPDNPQLRVTVPYHNRDLKRAVLRAILRQAGLSPQAFLEHL
ncbi:MAG TPA: type II toxin-antitoxin system HicA family toxin [Alphaproteobacteria bacterium]